MPFDASLKIELPLVLVGDIFPGQNRTVANHKTIREQIESRRSAFILVSDAMVAVRTTVGAAITEDKCRRGVDLTEQKGHRRGNGVFRTGEAIMSGIHVRIAEIVDKKRCATVDDALYCAAPGEVLSMPVAEFF